jgi:hypothetical protein
MKKSAYLLLLFLLGCYSRERREQPTTSINSVESYIKTLKPYLSTRYNQDVAFYADLSLPARKNRFFVLDLKERRILEEGLCLNGLTNKNGNVIYSNKPGSNCSSRGVAKVSYRYHGKFGKAYKLVGLEATNNNMMRRAVVLHSYPAIPLLPLMYVESQGCPTVSPQFLETLSTYIDGSKKPILLYTQ